MDSPSPLVSPGDLFNGDLFDVRKTTTPTTPPHRPLPVPETRCARHHHKCTSDPPCDTLQQKVSDAEA